MDRINHPHIDKILKYISYLCPHPIKTKVNKNENIWEYFCWGAVIFILFLVIVFRIILRQAASGESSEMESSFLSSVAEATNGGEGFFKTLVSPYPLHVQNVHCVKLQISTLNQSQVTMVCSAECSMSRSSWCLWAFLLRIRVQYQVSLRIISFAIPVSQRHKTCLSVWYC